MTATHPSPGSSNGSIDWAAALEQHQRWLRTVVLSRVVDRHVADEVMQNVALAAVRQTNRPEVPQQAAAWLYRVAVRQSLLYRRKNGRERRRLERYADRLRDDRQRVGADPLGWLLADERASLVRDAVQRLAARDRELLMLKYTEDWSCRQLAEHLGVQVTTVETRLHRARQRLRRELARLNVIETPP